MPVEIVACLALALAAPALALACLAIVKARMPEFCPGDRVRLLLPLQFTNAGHADGVVEWIAIRFTVDERPEQSLLLSPVAEVDMETSSRRSASSSANIR
jgi:hypothetical protein